jgi:glutaconate CoA-transferase subunit A
MIAGNQGVAMTAAAAIVDLETLASEVPDGTLIAVPPDYTGVPMAATFALIRRGTRDLRLYCVPYSTLQADVLIGAGRVASIEAAAVTLGEIGLAPRFTAAVEVGTLTMRDSTCPALHAALQASEKGVPFMPLRGLLGSDILAHRPDWTVIDSPFGTDDPIVLLPAVAPDVALLHAPMADRDGNVWIGRRREMATMVHAARRTLFTVETIFDGSFYDTEAMAAGAIPALYVDAVAVAPRGAWPLGLAEHYDQDTAVLRRYAELARTEQGFVRALEECFGIALGVAA